MFEKEINVITESKYTSMIPENHSILSSHENDSHSLLPYSDASALVTSEKTEPKGGHKRRYSTGDVAIPYTRVKILSRYLAASTGSCHDNCKYGTRHVFETKTGNSVMKRTTEKQDRDTEKTLSSADKWKKLAINAMPSLGSKSQKPNIPVVTKREVPPTTKKENLSTRKLSSPLKRRGAGGKTMSVRPAASLSVKKVLMRPKVSLSPKCLVKKGSTIDIAKCNKLKGAPQSKGRINEVEKAKDKQPCSEDVAEKILHIVESNIDNKTVRFSQSCGQASFSSAHDGKLKWAQRKVLRDEPSPSPVKTVLKRSQSEKHTIRPRPSSWNKCIRHTKDGTNRIGRTITSSKSTHGVTSCEHHETGIKNRAVHKLESKTRPKKGAAISTHDSFARRLNCREGNVVERQHEISISRRLKCNRTLSDSNLVEVDIGKVNLKKVEVGESETDTAQSESEKVVLRHQDVQGKKIVQNLLNNMIEETASKLEESRKSKVKALVGAFETVISLQDSKTSLTDEEC